VQRRVGRATLRGEAVDSITQDIYREALEQTNVLPYAPAALDDIDLEPLVLHITVPLEPTVDLGDYRQARVDPPEVAVTDEQVDEAMKAVRDQHALLEPADRPAEEGDVIIADLRAVQDEEVVLDREGAELLLDPQTLYPNTPFVENVVGISAGEERSFEVTFPADEDQDRDSEDGPRVVAYSVAVQEVRARYLPPLNDDLATEEGFETLLELRMDVRRRLTEAAQQRADAEYVDQVFDQIHEGAQVTYPPAAVEQELDGMVEDMERRYKRQGWTLEDYLSIQGRTIDTLREDLLPSAEKQLERSQITIALMRAERLTMDEAELDQRIDERLTRMGSDLDEESAGQMRQLYSSEQGRLIMANDMLMGKLTERLKAIGRGEAPDLPELPDEEE
jgi:trigger factor